MADTTYEDWTAKDYEQARLVLILKYGSIHDAYLALRADHDWEAFDKVQRHILLQHEFHYEYG